MTSSKSDSFLDDGGFPPKRDGKHGANLLKTARCDKQRATTRQLQADAGSHGNRLSKQNVSC